MRFILQTCRSGIRLLHHFLEKAMRPSRSILDRDFRYVPSVATSVAETWKRFGWRPMQRKDRTQSVDHDAPCANATAARAFERLVQHEANDMSRLIPIGAVALMILFAPVASAQVPSGAMLTSEADSVLTLLSVDPISRTAVLRGRDGVSLALELPAVNVYPPTSRTRRAVRARV
jgi:hypothetical protein